MKKLQTLSYKFLSLLFIILCYACGTLNHPYYSNDVKDWESQNPSSGKKLEHTLFLIGDAGELDNSSENYVLNAAKKKLEEADDNSTLVYLGDNAYPVGLPPKSDPARGTNETILNAQLELARDFEGNTYFIPGNHDWNKGHEGGRKFIKRQEDYIESYFTDLVDKKVKMYPSDACGDPKVVKIHKDLAFVFIDSQWWLQKWSKEKKMNKGCEVKSKTDFLATMEEIFVDHKNDQIVVLMHHPIKSNGLHGGKFSWKHHLFPLHELNNLYIPLPIIGSAYPLFRQTTGSVQDITNAHNKELMQGINDLAKALRVNVIFAAGHEHCMQYFENNKLHYIVTGSGAKQSYTRRGGDASYASEARGFTILKFYEDFETWVEYYSVAGFDQEAVLEFKTQIRAARAGSVEEEIQYEPVNQDKITLPANEHFAAKPFKKLWLGKQYRNMWATPVTVPVIDLEKQFGGLTPVKKGGGMASNSLRMQHDNGKQYILRSINKDYTKLVPPQFSNLKLIDVMKDQNSASHPYGALVIPSLSKAANVYFTHPKLVYLKHQRGLGNYNSQFPEELYLLEERPSGNWSDAEQFGNSAEIIGYTDLLETLVQKKNHFVDQQWVAKSRIFDLWLHDWDRHDDQWRWASFEEDGATVYRPIPRDRDQAFYKFVGIIPWYVSHFIQKNFKTIKGDVKDVKYLAFNARNFDRYFMNDLEWSEWETIVTQLQSNLTDEEIESAFNSLPSEIEALPDTEDLISKLKSRRENLPSIAKKLYDFLSKEVEVSATDNDDIFEIVRNTDGSVNVKYYVTRKKKGNLLKFDRTFYPNETKEIRLYGLRGKDSFTVSGASNDKIKIRCIGGEDDDTIRNQSEGANLIAYDEIEGIEINGPKVTDKTSNTLTVNEYDRLGFHYNVNLPSVFFGFTVDDGFWLGGGYAWTIHGWRKKPYKSKQKISFRAAPFGDDAFNVRYDGHFPLASGKLDFSPHVALISPEFENYFGVGNESINTFQDIQFNWVRLQSYTVEPLFQINNSGRSISLKFGPTFQSYDVKESEGRITSIENSDFTEESFERRNYLGAKVAFDLEAKESGPFPGYGFLLNANLSYLNALTHDETVTQFGADVHFYLTLITKPKLVLANNIGYQKNFGDLQFYQLADLGNTSNLRGFRNERFRGESAFFHNIDLRMFLFKWNNNFLPMDIGILGGYDYGRVYADNENSDRFHDSRTVGIWMNLLGVAILQPYYSFTEEENRFSLQLGFNF